MKKTILVVFTAALLAGCTSDNDFRTGQEQLESQGYTDVVKTGYNAFCCGKDDDFSTGFKAKDKFGKSVEVCFCSGMGKGITIRFE